MTLHPPGIHAASGAVAMSYLSWYRPPELMQQYSGFADEMLISLIASGDTDAFKELYLRHEKDMYLTAYNGLRSRERAEDIVQEVFVSLWNRRNSVQISAVKAWLLQAVKFQVLKAFRQASSDAAFIRRFTEVAELVENSPPLSFKDLPQFAGIDFSLLPKDQQEILRLRAEEGLTNKEIAAAMGISVKTVEKKMSLILQFIRGGLDRAMAALFFLFP